MDCSVACREETVDGACFSRAGTRSRMGIRAGAVPETVRPRVAAPPTAERSELGAELRRVVYGREEFVWHERGGQLNDRQRLR